LVALRVEGYPTKLSGVSPTNNLWEKLRIFTHHSKRQPMGWEERGPRKNTRAPPQTRKEVKVASKKEMREMGKNAMKGAAQHKCLGNMKRKVQNKFVYYARSTSSVNKGDAKQTRPTGTEGGQGKRGRRLRTNAGI